MSVEDRVITFSINPLVRVALKAGIARPGAQVGGGLIKRFVEFLSEEGISSKQGVCIGPVRFEGYYTAEDAKRIETWLLEQGAVEGDVSEVS
jgi:hypothetical protein